MIELLASRYGLSPFEVARWPMLEGIRLYYAAQRNQVRERIGLLQDRLATNELSMETKRYDKYGREIKEKSEERMVPVGFQRHLKNLLAFIGEDTDEPDLPSEEQAEAEAEDILGFLLSGGAA
jgi:hypothetical protein